jgi:RimJ/RimL family protein N-acetyltransferase
MSEAILSIFDPALHIPRLLFELPHADVKKGWSDFLGEITHRMHDSEFAEDFRNAVPIEGADASEYNYRYVEHEDLKLVLSLRFKALTMTEPFIEVLLCNQPIDREVARAIGAIARKEYARFQPDRIRYLSLEDAPLWKEDQEDFAFFVGEVEELQRSKVPDRYDEIELRRAVDLSCYPKLLESYRDLTDARELRPESEASLKRSLEEGLLYEAFMKGQWAGMMAAQRMTDRFLTGVYIVEEVLSRPFRGEGYAPVMQRKFIDQLEGDQLVFGEILWWNERSRRTALRVGRKKCGTTFFHSIE